MNSIDRLAVDIKKARLEKGLTQEELAELLNITPTHVKHIESGHRKPSVDVLFSIAEKLNMSLDNIIFTQRTSSQELQNSIDNLLNSLCESELRVIYDTAKSLKQNIVK